MPTNVPQTYMEFVPGFVPLYSGLSSPHPPLPTRIQFWASFRPIIRTRIHNVDMVDTRLEPRLFGCLRNQPDALDIEERIGLLWETIHSQFRHRFQTDGGEPTITTRHPEPTQNGTGHLPRRVRQWHVSETSTQLTRVWAGARLLAHAARRPELQNRALGNL